MAVKFYGGNGVYMVGVKLATFIQANYQVILLVVVKTFGGNVAYYMVGVNPLFVGDITGLKTFFLSYMSV